MLMRNSQVSGWKIKGLCLCILVLSFAITGITPMPFPSVAQVSAEPIVPYDLGNWTYVNKPVLPVRINASQIPIGSDWTYVYPLDADSAYRVYCYGDWIDYSSSDINKTDYDIFVYNPSGELESYHTEAAGLPEHLGTTVDHPFFIPKQTGNYSFQIRNDARESNGSAAATFMLIEHIDSGRWYSRYMEGKVDDEPVEKTTWAYEFNTTSSRIEVWVDVPDNLDMYEARLYVMTNPKEEENLLNGVPLAWEPGLYGNTSEIYGGYNLDSEGFRIVGAMASCEYPGEDMLINFTAPVEGNLLYHLAFIAEHGEGTIDFMVKTDFDSPQLTLLDPIEKTTPSNPTGITAHIEEEGNLETVTLNYTTDGWGTSAAMEMVASQKQTYNATIPGQPAGTKVNYTVLARDTSGNSAEVMGGYEVKNLANLTLGLSASSVYYGENITVTGSLPVSETDVTLTYALLNSSVLNVTTLAAVFAEYTLLNETADGNVVYSVVSTDALGNFTDTCSLKPTGTWFVWADWNGSETYFPASSSYLNFTVIKQTISLTCNVTSRTVTIGENVTVVGQVYPMLENLNVTVVFIGGNSTVKQTASTDVNGTYILSWKPETLGLWQINAQIAEDEAINAAYSNSIAFTVNDTFLNQYLLIIIGAVGGVAGVVAVVFIIRRRREE
jgi:hypothetical protein